MAGTRHRAPPSDPQLRVKALESVLLEKKLIDPESVDAIIEHFEHKVGPHIGARLVARAWCDPAFKARLLADASKVVVEEGVAGMEGTHMLVKENTPQEHNLVVCTLCSCYPWAVLGLPPTWYKSTPYRARAVSDPRGLLRDLGLEIGADVTVRVWDSNAELRFMVLPMRPAGTEQLNQDQLAALVTRDAMVGTAVVPPPA